MNKLFRIFKRKKTYKTQSFTYYIPSPPPRKSGYREKQFDKVFYEFINLGYDIVDFKVQSNSGEERSGMWIIVIVRATNSKAERLDLGSIAEGFIEHEEEEVEGLYQINN